MTTPRKAFLALVPAAILILAMAFYLGGHETPASQPPLADLNSQSFAAFKQQFNGASDQVRIILLLSPT